MFMMNNMQMMGGGEGFSKFNFDMQSQNPNENPEEGLSVLNGYKYSVTYVPSKGPRRRKRIIHCEYDN